MSRQYFDNVQVRRTPYTKCRPADPSRDVDLAGNPIPPDYTAFYTIRKTPKGEVEKVVPLSYQGPNYGYTDWKCEAWRRSYKWFVYMYVKLEGVTWVGKHYAESPPEYWRDKMFRENGIIVSASGQIVK